MHLLEAYALCSGCKIKRPFIKLEAIPLPAKPYITFHGFCSKAKSRQYKYWNEVLSLLDKDPSFNYEIVQIGEENDERYNWANYEYLGKTNYNSLAYLIRYARLHLGFDSLPMHLASCFNIDIVALFNSNVQNSGPYFSDRAICLHPDFSIQKPSYSYEDSLDLINKIDPFLIYSSVIKLEAL